MSRYIDADAAIQWVEGNECYTDKFKRIMEGVIDKQPTVDDVPVVRCRECKYAHLTYDGDIKYCDLLAVKDEYGDCDPCFYRSGDWFCADGERKVDADIGGKL